MLTLPHPRRQASPLGLLACKGLRLGRTTAAIANPHNRTSRLSCLTLPAPWRCLLQCGEAESVRCGRQMKKHALQHYNVTEVPVLCCRRLLCCSALTPLLVQGGHALCMNLQTRMIWCYACDKEIKDAPKTDTTAPPLLPQDVRMALTGGQAEVWSLRPLVPCAVE